MLVRKAFRYRIYPNTEQQAALAVQFGHSRFVYNWALDLRRKTYRETGKGLTYPDTNWTLTKLKKVAPWLCDADSQILQEKLRDLQRAFDNFFEKRASYPRFKSKHGKQSIRYPQRFKVEGKRVYLPKVGWVKAVFHRSIEGEMKTCTVSKTKSGRYFISIQCEVEISEPNYTGGQVGIDLGLADFITVSDGERVPPPKYLRTAERKLKRLQRQLSRKQRGSRGREKARLQLARQHEKVGNQRQDFQHKLSRRLVECNRLICFENLNVVGMLKNHHLAKSIADAGWSEFVRQCQYKGGWYGCHIEQVGRFFPSSKLCSACGERHQGLRLSDRKWVCTGCGAVHQRDANASANILVEGLRIVSQHTAGAAGINAGGEVVRPTLASASPAVSAKPEAQLL